MTAMLEHVNVTVADPKATAAWLQEIFGWHTRWAGDSIYGGLTVHVGTDAQYLALYAPPEPPKGQAHSYTHINGLNHIAVVVDDLDATEARVKGKGFSVGEHYDYEPGRRFYFDSPEGIEFEVVEYD
ncbi:Glyoxalase family protein [Candidatus Rhodobacter oscarellae]|uniref:Glyoxalase family protein n=1 Tax=Candidatus Rhodobacter oscarellae TaxID=1675527 RepID=A0A0J9GXV3_9RHOB|nr:VOC family protein [Candidatus Rhodobacter lobularis]KMW58308.1 Glyoxalase family protein [Candidatus Rhodobacter lobularis]